MAVFFDGLDQFQKEALKSSLLQIPVPQVLVALGRCQADRTRANFFYSPFRMEKTPSFHYIPQSNTWKDFSTGDGGGVLLLISKVLNCSTEQSWEFLGKIAPYASQVSSMDIGYLRYQDNSACPSGSIVVDSYGPIRSSYLLSYGESRGISRSLLESYCCQVSYHYSNREGTGYNSLGFSNIKNGFVLTNRTRSGRKIKLCTSCAPTFINALGRFALEPSSDTVMVTEGFMDALSWMQLSGRNTPGCDLVVLNSLSMASEGGAADRYIRAHRNINIMLDHDIKSRAGQKKTEELVRRYAGHNVVDASGFYSNYKDINDLLQDTIRMGRSLEASRVVQRKV